MAKYGARLKLLKPFLLLDPSHYFCFFIACCVQLAQML